MDSHKRYGSDSIRVRYSGHVDRMLRQEVIEISHRYRNVRLYKSRVLI
jgi:hypothetical protein